MKVILQKDVKNLGKVGDTVRVKSGYARNYLLPQKLALSFNESFVEELKHKKTLIEARKKQALSERKALVEKLQSVELVFVRESRDEGMLFGSVTAAEISTALEKEKQILVDKRDLQMDPIKKVGEYDIETVLDSQNKGTVKVIVKGKSNTEKKKKFGGFFSTSLFSKKSNESEQADSTPETEAPHKESSAEEEPLPSQDDSSQEEE